MNIYKLCYRLIIYTVSGVTGLPSYRSADHILSLFFKLVNHVKETSPYHLTVALFVFDKSPALYRHTTLSLMFKAKHSLLLP